MFTIHRILRFNKPNRKESIPFIEFLDVEINTIKEIVTIHRKFRCHIFFTRINYYIRIPS